MCFIIIQRADIANLASGDTVTVALTTGNITGTGATSGLGATLSGSAGNAIHRSGLRSPSLGTGFPAIY